MACHPDSSLFLVLFLPLSLSPAFLRVFSFRVFAYVNVYACPALGGCVPLYVPRFSTRIHVCTPTFNTSARSLVSCVRHAAVTLPRYVEKTTSRTRHRDSTRVLFVSLGHRGINGVSLGNIGDENLCGRNAVLLNSQSLSSS